MSLITDAELAQCQLDDSDLAFLELELRTGGNINIRQLLRAVVELKGSRDATARVQELEEQLSDTEYARDEAQDDARRASDRTEEVECLLCDAQEEIKTLKAELAEMRQQFNDVARNGL